MTSRKGVRTGEGIIIMSQTPSQVAYTATICYIRFVKLFAER